MAAVNIRWLVAGLLSLAAGVAAALVSGIWILAPLPPDGPIRWPAAIGIGVAAAAFVGLWGQSWASDRKPPPDTVRWPAREGTPPEVAACFQARPEQDSLSKALRKGHPAIQAFRRTKAIVVTPVLAGMGGVGKTQLAADYAGNQWKKREIDLLVWVNASNRTSIIRTYAAAAVRVGATAAADESNLPEAAERFCSWLAERRDKRWLVVLDDVADPKDLEGLKPPPSKRGNTIVTTRQFAKKYYSGRWKVLKVKPFTRDQAHQYLRDRLSEHPDALTGADELIGDLGCLPLALASASAYILDTANADDTGGTLTCAEFSALLAEYVARLDERRELDDRRELNDLMETEGIDGYERTVAAIWSISIERIEKQFPSGPARPLMELLSLLDPNGIPFAIFNTPEIHEYLECQSAHEIAKTLRVLQRFSLLTNSGDEKDRPVDLHVLIQLAVRDTTEPIRLKDAARALADSMSSLWPARQHDTDFVRLLQNNAVALSKVEPGPLRTPALHELLFLLGDSYGTTGLVTKAHEYFTALLKQATSAIRAEEDDILKVQEREAYWLGYSGDAKAAREKYGALAVDLTRVLSPNHHRTFVARHNAARFRGRDGDPPGAVADLEQLVKDESRELGPTGTETLKSKNILGYWLNMAGEHKRAVVVLEGVIPIWTEHYGPDHPETLRARNDLCLAKAGRQDYEGAIAEGEILVRDRTRVLGADKPETLSSRAYVAHWRTMAGEDSVAALETIVGDHVRVLGSRHPGALRAQAYYIEAIAAAGDVARAAAMMTSHLKVVRKVHGPTHILTTHCKQKRAEWRRRPGSRSDHRPRQS